MNSKTIFSITTALIVGMVAATAHAQTIAVGASASAAVPRASVQANLNARQDAALPKLIARGDSAIEARITSLDNLSARISGLKNVSDAEKASLSSQISATINDLTSLKVKIDADTDITAATTDVKSILGSYRIYALVIPQGYIAASADRITAIASMMSTISAKLSTRITASQQATLDDMNAKIADATAKASAALSASATLVPDQGDKTKLAANKAVLQTARADTKTATADLKAARDGAKTLIKALQSVKVEGSASAEASVQQ